PPLIAAVATIALQQAGIHSARPLPACRNEYHNSAIALSSAVDWAKCAAGLAADTGWCELAFGDTGERYRREMDRPAHPAAVAEALDTSAPEELAGGTGTQVEYTVARPDRLDSSRERVGGVCCHVAPAEAATVCAA
ncbi:MAG: hypothetical protein KDA51_07275, partial [Planctomycetales bacterium]|nr:hypothetical protein [Planctomycetales bacterium]